MNTKRTSGYWYLLALVPFALIAVHTVFWVKHTVSKIEAMPRVLVPGEGDFQLAKGEQVGYLETTSNVGGTTYHAPAVSVSCTVTGPDGAAIALESPSTTSSYTMGGFDGRSIFELTAPSDGTYHLACTGSNGPAAIAIGHSIMGGIMMMIGVTFALGIAAIVIVFVVRRKRKRAA